MNSPLPTPIRWLLSATLRKAFDLRRHARRLVNEQRDLLTLPAIQAMEKAIADLDAQIKSGADKSALETEMARLVSAAERWLQSYPHAAIRENVKEFLVAGTVILAITTFFLQLTKIPTGSMQPTLYGITHEDLRNRPGFVMPPFWSRWAQYWINGVSYFELIANQEGDLKAVEPVRTLFPFVKEQRFLIGDQWQTLWLVPDDSLNNWVNVGQRFHKGEAVVRLKLIAGDHLLVDRFTYNFRRPQRGEIIVFKTDGIPPLPTGELYIKRLVGLPNERLKIGNDQHLIVNGRRLDAATPHFENVYTFDPARYPSNGYFGHVNGIVSTRWGLNFGFAHFTDAADEETVPANKYFAFGDNTLNSYDSRGWGGLPQENVIGRHWFVYWPITRRFGWAAR